MPTERDSMSTGWLLLYVLVVLGVTYGVLAYVGAPL
ncbi:hypothetical protein HASA104033_00100 [Halobacterium salinarum]|uniref:Uncharacterized protein n=4 Tax=Halobacterium salinarum TaxID=2242 RepID=Q9HNF2_HALSA|nr:hypothetical protein VNG_2129H [Halobacterium salinarum NRC-1]MBB6089285.1 hypothetical protein [Halobacterium salinarum]QCC45757.1 uncharacterized protein HBSAL_10570 [Halobacterium salinarum]CAP14565.1 uncharacterized protein OE_3970R [Halobacterium salinarum R1]DAC79016.1 TPA_inf: uncharacterized protein VNG_2129H [Halobacterium salinarum NRC-1]